MFFQRYPPIHAPLLGSASSGHLALLVIVAAVVPLYLIAILLTDGPLVRLGRSRTRGRDAWGTG